MENARGNLRVLSKYIHIHGASKRTGLFGEITGPSVPSPSLLSRARDRSRVSDFTPGSTTSDRQVANVGESTSVALFPVEFSRAASTMI